LPTLRGPAPISRWIANVTVCWCRPKPWPKTPVCCTTRTPPARASRLSSVSAPDSGRWWPIDARELLTASTALKWRLLALAVPAVVVLTSLVGVVLRRRLRPLAQVLNTLTRIGGGDLDPRMQELSLSQLGRATPSEVTLLARGVADMVARFRPLVQDMAQSAQREAISAQASARETTAADALIQQGRAMGATRSEASNASRAK
jgi:methyl-accepting chemotaxis protein